MIVAGFPGVGKSWLAGRRADVLDSDSSAWDKHPGWANGYVGHLVDAAGRPGAGPVMCSTHFEVRAALEVRAVRFVLAYPHRSLRASYRALLVRRGTPGLAELVNSRWDEWLTNLMATPETVATHLVLGASVYLGDVLR